MVAKKSALNPKLWSEQTQASSATSSLIYHHTIKEVPMFVRLIFDSKDEQDLLQRAKLESERTLKVVLSRLHAYANFDAAKRFATYGVKVSLSYHCSEIIPEIIVVLQKNLQENAEKMIKSTRQRGIDKRVGVGSICYLYAAGDDREQRLILKPRHAKIAGKFW